MPAIMIPDRKADTVMWEVLQEWIFEVTSLGLGPDYKH